MEPKKSHWSFSVVEGLVSISYFLGLVGLGLSALVIIVYVLIALTGRSSVDYNPFNQVSIPVTWEPNNYETVPVPQEPRFLLKAEKQAGQVQVPLRSLPGFLKGGLELVNLVTSLWILFLLRQIFRTASAQLSFQAGTVQRIKTMGLLLIGQTAIKIVLWLAIWLLTRDYFDQIETVHRHNLKLDIEKDGFWFLGLVLLAVAQVYQRGVELQLEVDQQINS